jgi:hypothetical protein
VLSRFVLASRDVGAFVFGGDGTGNIEVTGPTIVDSPLVEVPLP